MLQFTVSLRACEFVNLYSECIEKKITAEILIKKTVFKAMSKNIELCFYKCRGAQPKSKNISSIT